MRRFVWLALVVLTSCLLLAGCAIPSIVEVNGVKVTAVVKSPPLPLGDDSTSFTVDKGLSLVTGSRLDPVTGEVVVTGDAGDSIYTGSADDVEVPQNLQDALDLSLTSISFNATLGDLGAGMSYVTAAITIVPNDPDYDTIVIIGKVKEGLNTWPETADDEATLAALLALLPTIQDVESFDLNVTTDGEVLEISDIQIIGSASITEGF